MKILILVDIQNDFCPGGSLAVPNGNEVVAKANQLAESGEFALVIATKDWHPADHVSYATNHSGKTVFSQIELNGKPQTLWPIHCQQATKGAEFHPDLKQELIDYVVEKGTRKDVDSYSGFYDNDRSHSTQLNSIIENAAKAAGIPISEVELVVAGLALDYCVAWTAIDAKELGYKTTVAVDATRAVNLAPGDDLKTLRDLAGRGIEIRETRDILPAIEIEHKATSRVQELHP